MVGIPTSDEDVVYGSEEAHRRMVDYRLPDFTATDVTATDVTVVDQLPANMRTIESSIASGGSWSDPNVTWQQAQMEFEPIALHVEVEPLEAGTWPTNVQAYAELTDGRGRAERIDFPVPEIEVIAPTPEPGEPTSARAPPTPTATPRPSVPSTIYLPWLARNSCWPKNAALDLVLALDSSSSKAGDKLASAKAASQDFLDLMRLEPAGDLAALVSFDGQARVLQDLTSGPSALSSAQSAVETSRARISIAASKWPYRCWMSAGDRPAPCP